MPILAMTPGGKRARLGYDLSYSVHGSFGRAAPGGPADRGAWPVVRWRGPALALSLRSWRAVGRSYGGLKPVFGGFETRNLFQIFRLASRSACMFTFLYFGSSVTSAPTQSGI
jgi:hypothetical protein